MASTRLFVLLVIGTVLLCQVSGFLDELLAEHELPQDMTKRGCRNAYSSAICGKVITADDCMRKSSSRMGSFARKKCQRLCGIC
uniref:U-actitoxin-Avd8d n=1 Tax=Anemonia viridis TaxID=51769 RepID=TX8D_ANEVI|nr:RecName: Full=U-actitoxin-Avd8d; Short=U-AITX-Avd8d; AltName: Full=Avtx-4; Flags: Precursor [Anemonia viridis]